MRKEEDEKPIPLEVKDPKPPVVRSGHLENRRQYSQTARGMEKDTDWTN